VGHDVFVDNDTLLMTDFVNLKIKPDQSFGCAHMDRLCVHVFIWVSARRCISIYVYTMFLKKKVNGSMNLIRSPQTQEGGTSQCRLHRGECPYVYEYLYLYYASKKSKQFNEPDLKSSNVGRWDEPVFVLCFSTKKNGSMNLIRSPQTWEGGTSQCLYYVSQPPRKAQ
jgi:hypothetical protein